jgi:hypothetical protein
MKKIIVALLILFSCGKAWAWPSETGSGVVSANENIVRASLEALQVLQSDVSTNLYGVTLLGATANYASFDSGGVESFRNVVSSVDVVKMLRNQYFIWRDSRGNQVRAGVSNDDVFTWQVAGRNDQKFNFVGKVSANDATVTKFKVTSVDTNEMRVSGNLTRTSSYVTGTCTFTFNNGLLTNGVC